MGLIALEGMHFHEGHGYFDEETLVGNNMTVDVYIYTDFTKGAKDDNLAATINYGTVYQIVRLQMKKRQKLLETLAYNIIKKLKLQFPYMDEVKVRVKKHNPPLGKPVDTAFVELEENFSKKCAKCGKKMHCYHDESCWCMSVSVPPSTLDNLKVRYPGCLCPNCLGEFAV